MSISEKLTKASGIYFDPKRSATVMIDDLDKAGHFDIKLVKIILGILIDELDKE